MQSPVAPHVEMRTISIEGIVVEQCPVSGGHWLDRGELDKLMRAEGSQLQTALESVQHAAQGSTAKRCPRDGAALVEVEITSHNGLRVDVCPVCGGIWLDANELSQALAAMRQSPPPPTGPITPPRTVLRILAQLTSRRV